MQLTPVHPQKAGMSAERLEILHGIGQKTVSERYSHNLVLLAARRGRIVYHEAFGHQGPDATFPAAPKDTIYPLNSLTKSFTAALAMILVERGRLGLYRPVSEYLPEFRGEGKEFVMVANLLTHTSGLTDPNDDATQVTPQQLQELLESPIALNPPVTYQPMSVMTYANINYDLLGVIIERIADEPLDAFARENLFDPLGLKDTSYGLPDERLGRLAWRPDDDLFSVLLPHSRRGGGATGAFSTAYDTAVFTQMFLNGGSYDGVCVLSSSAVRAMTTDQVPGLSARLPLGIVLPVAGWGMGWNIHAGKTIKGLSEALMSRQTFVMNGAGFTASWCDPAAELVGVYFAVNSAEIPDFFGNLDLFVNVVTGALQN